MSDQHTLWNVTHHDHFKLKRSEAKTAFKFARDKYYVDIADKLADPNTSSKAYWRLTKLAYGQKAASGILHLLDADRVITDDGEKCSTFNNLFSSHSRVDSSEDINNTLPFFTYNTPHRFNDISTTPEELFKILYGLSISKASGPDDISNKVLRECVISLAEPLSRLFNLSFSFGVFPSSWKLANVVPIHMKDDRQQIQNYRPVSLLSNISKVKERIVHNALYSYCTKYKLLTDKNSGLKANDNTVNQLLIISKTIINALDSNKNACMIFLDITKAFDIGSGIRVYYLS